MCKTPKLTVNWRSSTARILLSTLIRSLPYNHYILLFVIEILQLLTFEAVTQQSLPYRKRVKISSSFLQLLITILEKTGNLLTHFNGPILHHMRITTQKYPRTPSISSATFRNNPADSYGATLPLTFLESSSVINITIPPHTYTPCIKCQSILCADMLTRASKNTASIMASDDIPRECSHLTLQHHISVLLH